VPGFKYAMEKMDAVLEVESTLGKKARTTIKRRGQLLYYGQTWTTTWEAKDGQKLAWKWNAACANLEIENKLKRLAGWTRLGIDSAGFVEGIY